MGYRYELHCHSKEGSACSAFPARDLPHFYHHHGFDGLVLTDHFSGNSALSDELSWSERVNRFYDIYESAREVGEKIGCKVFFGMEYSLLRMPGQLRRVTGNDFLILGLEKNWWLAQENVFYLPPVQAFDRIREAGGFIIHAHPFLEESWVECIRLLPRSVDAVEVINGHLPPIVNDRAEAYARSYGLLETAGTDTHGPSEGYPLCGVETRTPCQTVQDLIQAIRAKRSRPFPYED